jgi:hypothetical protein
LLSRSLWDGAGLKKPIAPSRQFSYAPLFTSGERDFSSSQPLVGTKDILTTQYNILGRHVPRARAIAAFLKFVLLPFLNSTFMCEPDARLWSAISGELTQKNNLQGGHPPPRTSHTIES